MKDESVPGEAFAKGDNVITYWGKTNKEGHGVVERVRTHDCVVKITSGEHAGSEKSVKKIRMKLQSSGSQDVVPPAGTTGQAAETDIAEPSKKRLRASLAEIFKKTG
eukprot:TRINITY_DN31582_c0_g1_i1.p2 TRINITY_DN31582_c0_g1~~TRINITY_DN31582_c0_g1_i1.p2  ORF type:complete len:107 (-),score=24.35 TRINITY_DN31582_c0_g1_i1:66-386(-)